MKPHEEEWDATESVAGEPMLICRGKNLAFETARFATSERARLAAQAPVMARILLEFLDGETQSLTAHNARRVLRAAGVIP